MRITTITLCTLLCVFLNYVYADDNLATHLQDVSVTVKSGSGSGSGTLITRNIKPFADSEETETVTFVWTAGHVVDGLRSVRTVIDPKTGTERKVVEFADANLVKELIDGGRKVGETSLLARVIKYSDSENGEDLALLMVRKRNFVNVSATFYLNEEIIPIGTTLFHVGSLRGQFGANSMTSGIMAQVGRVLPLGSREDVVFDQTTATAFPGSSGGGVFLAGLHPAEIEKGWGGQYVGMLVRGGGETFNFIVPIRRMVKWAERVGVMWALDPSVEPPTLLELLQMKNEDVGELNFDRPSSNHSEYPFLLHRSAEPEGSKENTQLNGIPHPNFDDA